MNRLERSAGPRLDATLTNAEARGEANPAELSMCLVSMPFVPITMPSLGVSTLKAALQRSGIRAEVYYGALDYFGFYCDPDTSAGDALLEYDYIALNSDIGDLFFAPVLWREHPDTFERVARVLRAIRDSPNMAMSPERSFAVMTHIEQFASRAEEFIEHCYSTRDWERYDVVGFSSTFSQNVAALCLARLIRERHPRVGIIFGGANCEGSMGEQLLRSFPWVDSVIRGEADLALPSFARAFAAGADLASVPGIVYRQGGRVVAGAPPVPVARLDDVPVPDFDDYFEQLPPLLRGPNVGLSLPVETSRGCWWGAIRHCTFCGLNPTTMSFRAKSPARALAEIEELSTKYRLRDICAVDNIISHEYFESVLPALEGKGYTLFYETKSNLDEPDVAQLSRAGVHSIQPGIESLSTSLLQLMRKGVSGIRNVALLKWCALYGVEPTWFLLYRFPDEPLEAYAEQIALSPRLAHLPPPRNPNPVLIDRFSPLFSEAPALGVANLRPAPRMPLCYRGLDAEALFNISYHFEADIASDRVAEYERPFWSAVLAWRYEAARGARFYQFVAPCSTLLVDTRREGEVRCSLLTGVGHHLHAFLRKPRSRRELEERLLQPPTAQPSLDDLLLTHAAGELCAALVESPRGPAELTSFLTELDTRWITVGMDQRWLALAIDCTDALAAAAHGLQRFVATPETLREHWQRVRREPASGAARGLLQLERRAP